MLLLPCKSSAHDVAVKSYVVVELYAENQRMPAVPNRVGHEVYERVPSNSCQNPSLGVGETTKLHFMRSTDAQINGPG